MKLLEAMLPRRPNPVDQANNTEAAMLRREVERLRFSLDLIGRASTEPEIKAQVQIALKGWAR